MKQYSGINPDRPQTNNDLMDRVGSNGKYQKFILIIFCCMWCITGMALMGTPFFFLRRSFSCSKLGLINQLCSDSVCSLPNYQWQNFIDPEQNYIETVSTQLAPKYYCDDTLYIDLTTSSVYFGAFVGYVLFSFLADNYGRRKILVLTWSIETLGTLIFMFAQNLPMAAIGLFLIGGGADASINMCFNFLSEVVEDSARQQFSVILQPWFAVGACILTTFFIFIENWRLIALILLVLPSCIILFFVVIYIEETPQFLLRKGIPKTLKALNRIGKINLGIKDILSEEDIINVINYQVEDKQEFHNMITPIDLIRFPSLRLKTICLCYIAFAVYSLYYGPALIIDSIGFNIYVSSYVVQISELIVYVPLYKLIHLIPRQKAGMTLFSISGICAAILLFINKPANCDFCSEAIIEIVIIAVFRSSIALYFIINYIYMVELYPSRARALGCGIASSVGTLASTLSPIVLGYFQRKSLNVNTIFALLALLGLGVASLLPQTKGRPLDDEIEQIQNQKQIIKMGRSAKSQFKSQLKSQFKQQYQSKLK